MRDDAAGSCEGKEAYRSPALAHKVLKRRRHRDDARDLDVYRCPFCGSWHLGTHRKRNDRLRRNGVPM